MSSWTPQTSSTPHLNTQVSQTSPIRGVRNARDLDRPLPPIPQARFDHEIPTLRRKPDPDTPNSTGLKHNRSFSHPFPSLFGSKKTDRKNTAKQNGSRFDTADDDSSVNEDAERRTTSPRNPSRKTSVKADQQPQNGTCMTCATSVRWPQGLKVYRCTTCHTINDLEPFAASQETPKDPTPHFASARKPIPLSLSRTRSLIDHCITQYLHDLLAEEPIQPAQPTASTPLTPPSQGIDLPEGGYFFDYQGDAEPASPKVAHGARNPSHTNISRRNQDGDQQTTVLPEPAPESIQAKSAAATNTAADPDPHIFATLERYITGCFAGCSALNASFFTVRPQRKPVPGSVSEKSIERHQADVSAPVASSEHDLFSDIDAKTLLLGDFAENGSWWAGARTEQASKQKSKDRNKSPETWRGIVTAKTPRINWAELTEWYHAVIHAGDTWQQKWLEIHQYTEVVTPDHAKKLSRISTDVIQQSFADSQIHLQRSLLKSTEILLKRPMKPLTHPEDCRFLFMLLANPLLHQSFTPLVSVPYTPTIANVGATSGSPKSPERPGPGSTRRKGGLGHHSGIIKRILGLLANLSNDVHQFLVAWMSRFSDLHFQRLVDLVGSFVTYRLSRVPIRKLEEPINPTAGLVPSFSDIGIRHPSELHAALEVRTSTSTSKNPDGRPKLSDYSADWQIKVAARVMALLSAANSSYAHRQRDLHISTDQRAHNSGANAKYHAREHGHIVPISCFYNTMLDYADLLADFESWETSKTRFTFCQYPFFLSIYAKIHILEHDAKRQMENKAREAFFDSILSKKAVSQFLVLKVRRDCLVDDSLRGVSEVVGSGADDIKKGLKIDFVGEEGIDAGGLRKEWFLLLVREIFDPHHGLFVYDDDSQCCYFNPFCFESSEQFFLLGVLLGLAIYNSTILDVAFPPFVFKKLLASAPASTAPNSSTLKTNHKSTLDDLAEYRPALAKGLRQLLDFEGDVQDTFCRDFVAEMDRYGDIVQVPLCVGGEKKVVTNSNRREFVDLYVHYLLENAVARQYEPFKRGFFTVCGGNALSLFRAEEIELLVRGSDEPLDIASLRAVATYEGWPRGRPADQQPQVGWFWDFFERVSPTEQRKILSFITGSDRIPAMGATNLNIRIALLKSTDHDGNLLPPERYPSARTCFNTISIYAYKSRQQLEHKLWTAVTESEGFGLK